VRISADWYVRGGIRTYVTAEHRKRGWKQAPYVHLAPLPATGSASAMPSSPDIGAR
jgi:7-cyano-7-deazaguanine reductase